MANMTTVLTEFSDNGNSRTFAMPAHTVAEPRLVVQKRKPALTPTAMATDEVSVVYGVKDVDGAILLGKVAFLIQFRRPANAQAGDITSALVMLKEIVNSDNFADVIAAQRWLQ